MPSRILSLILGVLMATQVSAIDNFFPAAKANLTKITWKHAVNDQKLLQEALNSTAMMLEADISIGRVNGSGSTIPIMAHPPANTSDLSLEQFLRSVNDFNNKTSTNKKGVKLDFKSIEAFNASINIIKIYPVGKNYFPIWLNADIISGPLNATTTPVNPAQFLEGSKSFNNSILSLGWTTNYGLLSKNVTYTQEQIDNMIRNINSAKVTQDVTFAVRAGIAAESLELMRVLKNNVSGSTLTIWSSEGDPVNVTKLRDLIVDYGVDKVYIDVPKELLDRINLPSSSSSIIPVSIVSVLTFIALCMKVV